MATPGNPLSDRYRRYKAGTNKAIEWLTSAARRCGGVAQDSTKQTAWSSRDLVMLAGAIAASTNPRIDIPLEILVIIEDVIVGRQQCADWYSANKDDSAGQADAQNQGHRNFIDVLRTVLDLLKNCYEKRLPKRLRQSTEKLTQMSEEIRQNIFEHLDIEEPTANPLGDRSNSATSKRRQRDEATSHIEGVEESEKSFALWCFFKDQYDLTLFLKQAWSDYMNGELSFVIVSHVTENAFLLMEQSSDSLASEYPCFAHMDDIVEWLGFGLMTVAGGLTVLIYRESKIQADADSNLALHDLFCAKAICILNEFREMAVKSTSAIPTRARNHSSLFAPALYSVLQDVLFLAWFMEHKGFDDNGRRVPMPIYIECFLRGLIDMTRNREMKPWLVTACSTYIQIYSVLGLNHTLGFETLHRAAPRLKQTVNGHQHFMSAFVDTVGDDTILRRHLETFRQVETDTLSTFREACPVPKYKGETPPFNLQKKFPVTCGSLIYTTLEGFHSISIIDCNIEFAVLAIAHLYKAARLSSMLPEDWPDMDWFIKRHGQQRAFVLEPISSSTPLTAMARNYGLALGVKPTTALAFRRYARTDKPVPAFQYADLPTAERCWSHGRVLGASSCSPFFQHMQDESKKNQGYVNDESSWRRLRELAMHKVAYAAMSKQSPGTTGATKQYSKKLTAVELLRAYKEMHKEDELNLNFDYSRLIRDCYRILSSIRSQFEIPVSGQTSTAYGFVNVLLWEAAGTEKAIKNPPKLADTMLSGAVKILKRHVVANGSTLLVSARAQCSGQSTPLDHNTVACPNAPDRWVMHLQEPYLGVDPQLFHDLGVSLREEGIDYRMDPKTNILSFFHPNASSVEEALDFLSELWGQWMPVIGGAGDVGREAAVHDLDDKQKGQTLGADTDDNAARAQKRQMLVKKLCIAIAASHGASQPS